MAKKDNHESKSTVTMSTGKVVALVTVPTLIIGMLGGYIFANRNAKSGSSNTSTSQSENENGTPSSTELGIKYSLTEEQEKAEQEYLTKELPFYDKYTKLDEDSTQKAASEMAIEFSLVRERECATLVQSSATSYDCYIYNNKNECIMQSADGSMIALFDKDGHNVVYNSNAGAFGVDSSVDVIACCESITNMIKNKREGVVVYAADTSEHQKELESGAVPNGDGSSTSVEYSGGKITEYIVDIRGTDACTGIYSAMGEESSIAFLKKLKDTLYNPDKDYWVPHIIYDVAYNEAHELEVYCSVVYEEPQENWILASASPAAHWELSSDWYALDLKKLIESDPTTLKDKFESEIEGIEKSLGIDELVDDLQVELNEQAAERREQSGEDTTQAITTSTEGSAETVTGE